MKNDQMIIVKDMQPSEKLYILALIHGLGLIWAAGDNIDHCAEVAKMEDVQFYMVWRDKLFWGCDADDAAFKNVDRLHVQQLECSYKKRVESGWVSPRLKSDVTHVIYQSGHLGGL